MGESESERNAAIAELVNNINARDAQLKAAERIKTIPAEQSYKDFFSENSDNDVLPIGYNTEDISVYGLKYTETFCYAVSEVGTKGISLVLNNIIYAAKNSGHCVCCIKLKSDIKLNIENADKVCRNNEAVCDLLVWLKEKFSERVTDKKAFIADDPDGNFAEFLCRKHSKIFIIIDSMNDFLNMIYDSSNTENMNGFVEACIKNGQGMGIYFIAGFESAVYGQNFYHPACKLFTEYKQGIHLGGRFDKQKIINVNMSMSQLSKPMEHFVGYTNDNGGEYKIIIPHDNDKERS